jgi:iron complex outermembrane receptor protein
MHRTRASQLRALAFGASTLALAAAAGPAAAQSAAPQEVEEIVVSGFRASLASAIQVKKAETSIVDVINAEDIADFPDLNLAESLQRIPGVAIDRDGGEGRTITVRGLSSDFTRVRLNGLEALAPPAARTGPAARTAAGRSTSTSSPRSSSTG